MWVLFVLAATFAVVISAPTTPAPPNGIAQCARSECPEYTVITDYGNNIVKRRIEPGVWVYKEAPTCNVTEAVDMVYLPLHYYFADNNISRTTPIMLETTESKSRPSLCPDHQPGTYPCCEELHRLVFYIPREAQPTAPQPTEELGVHLLHATQSRDFYVIDFSGRATHENVVAQLEELTAFLEAEDLEYDDDTHIVASYDAPSRPTPHRSEVLVPVKGGRRGGHGGSSGGKGDGDRSRERTQHDGGGRDGGRERGRRDILGCDLTNIDLIPF